MLVLDESTSSFYNADVKDAELDNTILAKVNGESMYPLIQNGDILRIDKKAHVESGDIVAIMVNGKHCIVKKVEFGDNWLELRSINPNYLTRRYEGKRVKHFKILGKVKSTARNIKIDTRYL